MSYHKTTGPGFDLERFAFERSCYNTLPNQFPKSGMQGEQILDVQNRHTESPQVSQMAGWHTTNPLPRERFIGTFHRHVNEPLPLSVNELMFE
jgi:hypothetical protein